MYELSQCNGSTVSCLLIISVLLQQVICFTHFCNYFVIDQRNDLSQTISEQQLRKDFDISSHTDLVLLSYNVTV
jgi:hypothetical protein